MDGNGVNIRDVGTVDPVYTFHNCVFRNGHPAPSALLVLHQDQIFTCNNAHFENATGAQYNVWKYESPPRQTDIIIIGEYNSEI